MSKRSKHILLLLLWLVGCNPETSFEGLMEVNQTELFVKTMGSGKPLIVIHGGPGLNHDYLLPHLEPLSESFLLVFYDQRASGRSSVKVEPLSMNMPKFVEDLEALRVKLGLNKVYLLAHSWGAQIASAYAIQYPENIEGIIYAHPTPMTDLYNNQIQARQAQVMDSAYFTKRDAIISSDAFANKEISAYEELIKLSYSLTFIDETKNTLNLNLNSNFNLTQTLLRKFKSPKRDFLKELSTIDVPSIVIHGTNDLTVIDADSALADALDAEVITFQTGHFSFVEQQEKFIDEVVEFVNN